MKSTRHLRLRLRLIEGALVLLLGALTTAAVSTHRLLLDATNRPTDDVSFSGPHWVGTLDAARLPASVPLLDGNGSLNVPGDLVYDGLFRDGRGGGVVELTPDGVLQLDNAVYGTGAIYIGGSLVADGGSLYANHNLVADYAGSLYASNQLIADGSGSLYTGNFQLADASNNIRCATGDFLADADGYLHTGSQSYQPGVVSPTGYLILKDATGTIYRVPAIAAP